MFIQTKYDMVTDISGAEGRKVFKDTGFMTLTDTLPWIFHREQRLYCSTCLLLTFAQGQHPQDQQWNGTLPGTTKAPAEIQICGRLWWNQNQLMEVSWYEDAALWLQDVCSVLLTFMQSKSVQWGSNIKLSSATFAAYLLSLGNMPASN